MSFQNFLVVVNGEESIPRTAYEDNASDTTAAAGCGGAPPANAPPPPMYSPALNPSGHPNLN